MNHQALHDRVIAVNGARLCPDLTGAVYWPDRRLLAVADLHLEKGSSFAPRGQFLPPYDTNQTLSRLAKVIACFAPETVICLGDSFHDSGAAERLEEKDATRLAAMAGGLDWVWICGNHDPSPPAHLGGRIAEELVIGPLRFRHEARRGPQSGELSGHFHPKASVNLRGRRISRRCFISDGRRLILPSFGAYTGGLSVRDSAISRLFGPNAQVWMLGERQIHRFPIAVLR